MSNLDFPYRENTLDGVFGKGIRTNHLNIKYNVKLSTVYENTLYASYCFDGNASTFCHSDNKNTEKEYLQIHFIGRKFRIEGIAMLNRKGKFWDPLNYVIQGSNNGIKFDTLGTFNEDATKVCNNANNRTRTITTNNIYSYFRLQTTGSPCNINSTIKAKVFNIAEFDLFGSFINVICQELNCNKHSRSLHCLIFLIYSSR